MTNERILIIGAGACGLYAAHSLAEDGNEVVVLEARNRIGGRIFTLLDKFSCPAEIGAEFIHGDQPLTNALAKMANAKTHALKGEWRQLRSGNIQKMELFGGHWEEMLDCLGRLKADMPLATFLDMNFSSEKYAAFRESVISFVEGYDAADANKVSSFALREEWKDQDDEEQFRLDKGYDALLQYLEGEIRSLQGKILLDSVVESIEWSVGKVKVNCKNGLSYHGTKLIITIPVGVLQRSEVRFEPPLPFAQNIFECFGFGGVTKFLFEFKEPFWKDKRNGEFKNLAFVITDAVIPTWWTQNPVKVPLLTGWLGGPSTFVKERNVEKLHAEALRSLEYVFQTPESEIRQLLQTWHISDWITDPFARGAYAYATTETEKARAELQRPINDTLYFAGEGMYEGPAMGTVEAALSSAANVAKQIIKKPT